MVLPESRASIQPTGLFTNCQADPVLVPLAKPSEIQSALSLPAQLLSSDNRYSLPETGVNGRKALIVELGTFARVPSVVQPPAAIARLIPYWCHWQNQAKSSRRYHCLHS